ncbi:MAG: M23 family metallopeptidase [Chlorobi bacterium]|nr:M23 family metallopeptidase [Chlorobiota bacterium]
MARTKYIYDPESLTYIQIEVTLKDRIKKILPYVFTGMVMGIAAYVFIAVEYYTPKEKLQAKKIKVLEENQKILNERIEEAGKTLNTLIAYDDSVYRTVLGAKPLPKEVRMAGTGGINKYETLEKEGGLENVIESFKSIDKLMAKMEVQKSSYHNLMEEAKMNVHRLQHLPAIIPIANWDLKRIGSGFGMRYHPILHRYRMHEGIDFIAPTGTSVFASADGVVRSVRRSDSFGKVIEIDHGYGIVTLYAHLSKIKVKRGQKVVRGEIIGLTGNTGLSLGPHLHYEVHVRNREVDPVSYFFKDLTAEEYEQVVARAQSYQRTME